MITHGRYQEAASLQALRPWPTLVPDKRSARQILALLQWGIGDHDGHRTTCRGLLQRFQDLTDANSIEPLAIVCLLNPDVGVDRATIEQWARVTSTGLTVPQLAHVLAEYRLGNYEHVVEGAGSLFSKAPGFHQAGLRAVQACALAKLGRYAEASDALRKAREEFDNLPRPGRIEPPSRYYWWETLRADALIREAEKLLPAAPAQVIQVALSAQEQAARGERKTRAEEIATQAALALIRLDVGQKKEAEAELRAVLAERAKIVAEEPDNPDYQAELAAVHRQIGQFFMGTGQLQGKGCRQSDRL